MLPIEEINPTPSPIPFVQKNLCLNEQTLVVGLDNDFG